MGLLTDPSLSQKNPIAQRLVKHTRKISFTFYLASLIWFCCLGHPNFNYATYISENALSPGLVYSEITRDSAKFAQNLFDELNRERVDHKTNIPYSWLIAKMKQIGLETHTHNFTLNYPFGGGKTYHGKNVYGILRAPRISSTEGIVFSAPYRPPNSVHTEITASVPILLAFAEFARKKCYWSKDLIFVVTDQEQLGMHAWIEAYYQTNQNDKSVLDAGNLPARAGALQAAINLEIQDCDCDYLDVKIEGLNGQLPNLDMFNLVQRLAIREGLLSGYKQTIRKKKSATQLTVQENLKQILTFVVAQTNGVPTGNHGLFHRYRIESLTLEGVKNPLTNQQHRIVGAFSLLKTIEGISRSLNNLLEKFHQSFFFYILVSNDRYISIGDFIVCLMLMAGSLFIKAFFIWLNLNESPNDNEEQKDDLEPNTLKIKTPAIHLPYDFVGQIFVICVFFGILAGYLPISKEINDLFAGKNISTEQTISFLLIGISISAFSIPIFITLDKKQLELLHVLTLLYIGSALIVVGLLNFSLGFVLATFITPLAIIIDLKEKSSISFLTITYTILLHPLVITYLASFILTLSSFPEIDLKAVAFRAVKAAMDGITFTIVDSIIYNNWLFTIASMVFFPAWILIWIVVFAKRSFNDKKHNIVKIKHRLSCPDLFHK